MHYHVYRLNYAENIVQQKSEVLFPFWQDPDELEYAEPPSAYQWIPTGITPISPGTVTPKFFGINLKLIKTCVKQ